MSYEQPSIAKIDELRARLYDLMHPRSAIEPRYDQPEWATAPGTWDPHSNALANKIWRASRDGVSSRHLGLCQRFIDRGLRFEIPLLPENPATNKQALWDAWIAAVDQINENMQMRLAEVSTPSPNKDYSATMPPVNVEIWEGAAPAGWDGKGVQK